MTGAETTIVHLHVKSLPAKYFVHQPNIFRKKSFFLSAANTVMPKMSPMSVRFNDKSCKIRVHSHSCSMPPCWIDFRCLKSKGLKTMSFFFTYGHPTTLGWLIINSCNIVKFAFFSLDLFIYILRKTFLYEWTEISIPDF